MSANYPPGCDDSHISPKPSKPQLYTVKLDLRLYVYATNPVDAIDAAWNALGGEPVNCRTVTEEVIDVED